MQIRRTSDTCGWRHGAGCRNVRSVERGKRTEVVVEQFLYKRGCDAGALFTAKVIRRQTQLICHANGAVLTGNFKGLGARGSKTHR